MQCVLGDIKKDPSYYLKALELSNNRSYQALASLGKHYFNLKNMEESQVYYQKAVELNPMSSEGWQSLGYIHL